MNNVKVKEDIKRYKIIWKKYSKNLSKYKLKKIESNDYNR